MDALLGHGDVEEERRRLIRVACKHGQRRREQGLSDSVLHREHHLLRAAIWDFVQDRHGSSDAAFEVVSHVDVASTLVTSGSLHGYHIEDLESREETVARLAEVGPWRPPV